MSISKGGIRRVGERVPMDELIRRAQSYGVGRGMIRPATLAAAIWPENTFRSAQGAALAAGGVIGEMKRRGLIEHRADEYNWGWVVVEKKDEKP